MNLNVNDLIKIKLTDRGRKIHRAYWEKLFAASGVAYVPLVEDTDGAVQLQLWQIMRIFGFAVGDGKPKAFDNVLTIAASFGRDLLPVVE